MHHGLTLLPSPPTNKHLHTAQRSPSEALQQPDPSAFTLTPPFPLQEEFITVNGIK